jgi:hypothetical protein
METSPKRKTPPPTPDYPPCSESLHQLSYPLHQNIVWREICETHFLGSRCYVDSMSQTSPKQIHIYSSTIHLHLCSHIKLNVSTHNASLNWPGLFQWKLWLVGKINSFHSTKIPFSKSHAATAWRVHRSTHENSNHNTYCVSWTSNNSSSMHCYIPTRLALRTYLEDVSLTWTIYRSQSTGHPPR